MRKTLAITAGITACLAAACATPQTNPHYKYSSKYEGNEAQAPQTTMQSASYQAPISYRNPDQASQVYTASSQTSSQPIYSGQAYDPAPQSRVFEAAPQPQVQPVYSPVYEADYNTPAAPAQYGTNDMIETGGQNGGQGGERLGSYLPVTSFSAAHQPALQQPEHLYAQTYTPAAQVTIAQQAPYTSAPQQTVTSVQIGFATQSALGMTYVVQESDTVYSLSRKTCGTVDAIKAINGLPDNFLIKAGETIRLPASTC